MKELKKRVVLDTNIIIKDPSIITMWTPMIELIIPDIVFDELSNLVRYGRVPQDIINLWEESSYKKFIKSIHISNKIIDRKDIGSTNLSKVDLLLAQYIKLQSKTDDQIYLATENYELQNFCKSIGIKVINLSELQRMESSFITTNLEEVDNKENIDIKQNKVLLTLLLSTIIITIIFTLIYIFYNYIINTYKVWVPFLLPVIGLLFYWIRETKRAIYGIIEVAFGILTSIIIFKINADNSTLTILAFFSIISSIFVTVRGLDTISQGVKGTKIEPVIRNLLS